MSGMNASDLTARLQLGLSAAREAGKLTLEYFQRDAITALHPGATTDIQRVIMARRIGIGGREREKAGTLR